MNVIDFPLPTSPITQAQVDIRHSRAFRDLESRLCNCVRMAHIAADMAAKAEDVDEDTVFAIVHTFEMLEVLRVDYYAAFEGGKPIEP